MSEKKWLQTNANLPCPICGQHGHCAVASNGSAAICHNTKSNKPQKRGGWLHGLWDEETRRKNMPAAIRYTNKKGRPQKALPPGPFEEAHFTRLATGRKQHKLCTELAPQLGVDARALESLDMRWDEDQKAVAFPMRTADGHFYTGVTYRHMKTGDKFNAKGSVDGLYMPLDLDLYDGELIVCEGASDTAAMLSCGKRNVVGRPGCRASEAIVAELCRLRHVRRVTIVADRDEPKDGATEGVGLEGAKHLGETLRATVVYENEPPIVVKINLPPRGYKDIRARCNAARPAAKGQSQGAP